MVPTKVKSPTFSDSIRIISANVNGFRAREGEIRRLLENQGNNCIMALSDTRLKEEILVREIEGYSMIRKDRKYTTSMATAGGVALIIPKNWSCRQVNLNTVGDHFEALARFYYHQSRTVALLRLFASTITQNIISRMESSPISRISHLIVRQ